MFRKIAAALKKAFKIKTKEESIKKANNILNNNKEESDKIWFYYITDKVLEDVLWDRINIPLYNNFETDPWAERSFRAAYNEEWKKDNDFNVSYWLTMTKWGSFLFKHGCCEVIEINKEDLEKYCDKYLTYTPKPSFDSWLTLKGIDLDKFYGVVEQVEDKIKLKKGKGYTLRRPLGKVEIYIDGAKINQEKGKLFLIETKTRTDKGYIRLRHEALADKYNGEVICKYEVKNIQMEAEERNALWNEWNNLED